MPISERTEKLKDELVQALIEDATATGDFELDVMPFAEMEIFGHGFGKALAAEIQQALAEAQAAHMNQTHDEQYACPRCGRICRADAGRRQLKTLDGEVEFREPKCTCKKCRKSFFPSA